MVFILVKKKIINKTTKTQQKRRGKMPRRPLEKRSYFMPFS